MGVRGCGLGYDHHVPEVLQKKLAPMVYTCNWVVKHLTKLCNL